MTDRYFMTNFTINLVFFFFKQTNKEQLFQLYICIYMLIILSLLFLLLRLKKIKFLLLFWRNSITFKNPCTCWTIK